MLVDDGWKEGCINKIVKSALPEEVDKLDGNGSFNDREHSGCYHLHPLTN